jgi:uncharacterized membrane protein
MLIHLIEEAGRSAIKSPADVGLEQAISNLILWLKLFAEIIGALLIGVGIVLAIKRFFYVVQKPAIDGYEKTRLILARFLSLGLEFQLAADILGTTVSPSWTQIGKLGAIAVIRTGLNYFLASEMSEEEEALKSEIPTKA